jgi:hypothetical protein
LSDGAIARLGDKLDRLEWLRDHWDDPGRYAAWAGARLERRASDDDCDGLDLADYFEDVQNRFHAAKLAYVRACGDRFDYRRRKLELSPAAVSTSEHMPLERAASKAAWHRKHTNACHPFITTERECIDAHNAEALAHERLIIAAQKYREQAQQARSDNRAGIVRASPRRKPQEVHL